jgi:glucose-6-phosphate 1-epimerase
MFLYFHTIYCPARGFLRIIVSRMPESAAALDQRFRIPGTVVVTEGSGGLTTVRINTEQCSGEVYLLGGQVTRWKPAGAEEVLWLSQHSLFQVGKAIRGGVPICFPWFGAKADDPKAPSHGFVRNREWQLESVKAHGGAVSVSLLTCSDPSTTPFWSADFELRLLATFGAQLTLELQLTNTGSQPVRAEEALHAYFTVADPRQISISGLESTDYIDKTEGNALKTQSGETKITSETDRVYLNTLHEVEILDPVLKRRITIKKENSLNSVVWNPWIEKAHSLSDFGDEEWKQMVCVEPSNVAKHAVLIPPGRQHTLRVAVSTARL